MYTHYLYKNGSSYFIDKNLAADTFYCYTVSDTGVPGQIEYFYYDGAGTYEWTGLAWSGTLAIGDPDDIAYNFKWEPPTVNNNNIVEYRIQTLYIDPCYLESSPPNCSGSPCPLYLVPSASIYTTGNADPTETHPNQLVISTGIAIDDVTSDDIFLEQNQDGYNAFRIAAINTNGQGPWSDPLTLQQCNGCQYSDGNYAVYQNNPTVLSQNGNNIKIDWTYGTLTDGYTLMYWSLEIYKDGLLDSTVGYINPEYLTWEVPFSGQHCYYAIVTAHYVYIVSMPPSSTPHEEIFPPSNSKTLIST